MIKTLAILAALAVAAPALADEGGPIGCGGEGGGGGGGANCPGGPADLPFLPSETFYSGEFNYHPVSGYGYGAISNSLGNYQYGATPYYYIYQPGAAPVGFGSTPVTFAGAGNGVSFASTAPALGEASISASSYTTTDATYVGFSVLYRITLHAADMAQADAIAAALAAAGGVGGSASGHWSTSIAGHASASVSASTGDFLGSRDLVRVMNQRCSSYVYAPDLSGCGSGDYTLQMLYARGDGFRYGDPDNVQAGDPLDFHATVFIGALSNTNLGGPGSAAAMIDPKIKFSQALQGYNFTATSGGSPLAISFVPEPAQWALTIGGFAMAGGVARRRRRIAHA